MSFLALLKTHEHLNELFLLHQAALLQLDLALALERLRTFERELRAHMQVEEELLLPIYQRAGPIPGGPVEFFTGEHQRMLQLLARFNESLQQLQAQPEDLTRRIIQLLDEEAMFKSLVQHHDAREENILYPTLDRVATEQEKQQLLKQLVPAS